jgi:nucleotide-binding universal stress UspA family protein
VILESGPIAEVIRHVSITHRADLVVIGRHENTGLLGRLRGNAYAIIRESASPVVSV